MPKRSDAPKTRSNERKSPEDKSLAELAREKWDLRHETWAQLVDLGMMPESDYQRLKELAGVE